VPLRRESHPIAKGVGAMKEDDGHYIEEHLHCQSLL